MMSMKFTEEKVMPKYIIFIFPDPVTSTGRSCLTIQDDIELVENVQRLAKGKSLFSVYRIGECIGDFS